jgi:glycosyltransferase involved in cell wall biosynthesis
VGTRLHWLDGISDEFLDQIYQACSALLATSLGEGFGLPIVEARLHGMPAIARDIPVFREIADTQTTFFSGTDPASLRRRLPIG